MMNGEGDTDDGGDPSLSTSPYLRSLSMSQNLAYSVLDEVPHMIRLPPSLPTAAHSSRPPLILTEGPPGLKAALRPSPSLEPARTPSPSFPLKRTSSLGARRNEVLVGILVSRWDNIVGPQCTYLWTEELTSLYSPALLPPAVARLVKYVTDKTVDHHEVDGNLVVELDALRSTLCLVHDLNLAYVSLSIRVPAEGSRATVPHSVSVMANLEYVQHFLLMRPLILNWLSEFAPKVGVLLCKNQLHTSMINSWCAELCKTMIAVRTCWWQKSLAEHQRALSGDQRSKSPMADSNGNEMTSLDDPSRPDSPYAENWDYLPPPFTKTALEMLLTSHLSTAGSTLVVGPDTVAINQVIRFLLCFSKGEEGYCSRYVLPTLPDTFMKGLYVQGLILGEIGERSISLNQINSNKHPFTYVEMSAKLNKIRQMPVCQHKQHRETTLLQELTALWLNEAFVSPNVELFPQTVKEVARFVSKFLTELLLLKPERRYARLLLFKRSLHSKALSLIAYLHSIRLKPNKERGQLLRRVKDTLRLDEAEYLIIQVTAEKIRPGTTAFIRSS